jgi:hypothetical protein
MIVLEMTHELLLPTATSSPTSQIDEAEFACMAPVDNPIENETLPNSRMLHI